MVNSINFVYRQRVVVLGKYASVNFFVFDLPMLI